MANLKISQFVDGDSVQVTDEIATNRGGVNTKVKVGSAAIYNVGMSPNDIPTNTIIPTTIANSLFGTSATENTIGTGVKSFITESGKSFEIGRYILIVDADNPDTNSMGGVSSSYDSETGELDVEVDSTQGSGTIDSWIIYVSGKPGGDGSDGNDGWSPVLAVVTDSARRVFQISDWVGGEGTKPDTGDYIGPSGLVSDIGDAVDVRGPQGAAGAGDAEDISYDDTGNTYVTGADVQAALDSVEDLVIDEDDMSSDSAVKVPTQQSVVAYTKPNRAYAEYASNASLTSVIPQDDTVPEIGEGTEILSVTITPTSATNRIRVRFSGQAYYTAAQAAAAAIFNGSTCINATFAFLNTSSNVSHMTMEKEFVAGGTSALTISVRAGPGSAGTIYFNGTSSRVFGGASVATLVVEEIKI